MSEVDVVRILPAWLSPPVLEAEGREDTSLDDSISGLVRPVPNGEGVGFVRLC